ncbi:MAG: rod shape-determining protein MreC [Candidatus Omnitrophica bacterium]|nr:rod shape-determining protein MreC [Candidatus Omnitrophota bacterium]
MFQASRKNLIYFLIFLTAFFVFFTRSESLRSTKFAIINLTSFPIRLLSNSILEVKKLLFYHRTFDEYKRLREENGVLKSRLIGLEEVMKENTRLEQLLEFKRSLLYSSIAANVIGREPSQWNSSVIIDKGTNEGVKKGAAVVNAQGVVGKITEVSSSYSKVILLTDPQFSVAALIQRPRETGILTGTLRQNVCRLRFLEGGSNMMPGDMVITSKLSSTFPEGLILGEIEEVIYSEGKLSVEAMVKPAVSLSQIEEVLVIIK